MTMIDAASAADHSQPTQAQLSDSTMSQSARYQRPAPRGLKEKKYRQLLKAKQQQTPTQLTEFLLGTVRMLRTLDAQARDERNRDIATFYQYYDCNEYGEFNAAGEWVADGQNDEGFSYTLPITPAHVDSADTLLTKVALEYEYKPKNEISMLDAQVARMCEILAEEDMARIFTDDKRAEERLNLLLAGKSYRHHYWAPNPKESNTVDVELYDTETRDMPSHRLCGNEECGTPLKESDTVCPKCLGDVINEVGGGQVNVPTARTETRELAENQMFVANPLAVQQDLSKRDISRSFIVYRDTLPRSEAEYLYCQTFEKTRGGISSESKVIRELERARLRTGARHNSDDAMLRSYISDDTDILEREWYWLEPWRVGNFVITEERWFVSPTDGLIWCETDDDIPKDAKHVKPGTFFSDIFPEGGFLCVVDDEIVRIKGETGSDKWIKLIFGLRPGNTEGAGLQRLRPLADMANDSTNLEFKVLMDDADPKTMLNRKYLTALSKVGEYTLVDNIPDGVGKDNIAWRLQGAGTHPALGIFSERVQAIAQFVAGTFSTMGQGAPDVKAFGTATGVVAMTEEASGRFIKAILQIAMADIESRFKVLKNRQKFSIAPQKDELAKRFGSEVAKRFFECNLRQLLSISKKKGTDQPQSQAIKIAQLEAYGNAVATIGQNPDGLSMLEGFAEALNLPVTVGIGMADKEEANRRISFMREQTQGFSDKAVSIEDCVNRAMAIVDQTIASSENGVPDEMKMQIIPPFAGQAPQAPPADASMGPVNPEPAADGGLNAPTVAPVPTVVMMQEHAVFMDAYKDWLLTEGARCNNQVLTMAITLMWDLHYQRDILKQKELIRLEVEKQQLAAPPAPPQPSPEEIKAAEDQANEDALATEALARMADEESKQADHDRQEDAKDADLAREARKMEYQAELNKDKPIAATGGAK